MRPLRARAASVRASGFFGAGSSSSACFSGSASRHPSSCRRICSSPPATPVASTSSLVFLEMPEALASFTFDLDPHKAVLYWRNRRVSLQLEHKRIDAYLAFIDKEYAWAVSRGIATSASGGRPAKCAWVDKGKGKARDEGPGAGDGAGDDAGPSA